jgi:plastocyanin
MKKSMIVITLLLIIAVAGGVYLITKNQTTTNMNMSTNNTKTDTPQATNAVAIQNFAFSPSAITIKKGTQVTWTNKDSVTHTVTETDGQTGPNSSSVNSGSSYSFTFNTAGTYHYHCSIHPDMTGTVTVTD